MSHPASLIGGIGLTELTVYEQRPAPDGQNSGCPHVHAICDEAYYVIDGAGAVEMHDLENGFRTLDLHPGQYVQFPPMVLHRIISHSQLRILGMMGNAGLAEAGDARIYFGPDVDADEAAFKRLTLLPKAKGLEGALERRDHAVRAYQRLLALCRETPNAYRAELRRFFDLHQSAVALLRPAFQAAIERGPLFWGRRSQKRLHQSADNPDSPTLSHDRNTEVAYGMCGVLNPVLRLHALDGVANSDRPTAEK